MVAACSGCSGLATQMVANALSGTGSSFARDNDPELIADAAPFGLKTMEAVLEKTPEHEGLLLSLASGYAQYGYAFVAESAADLAESDPERSRALTVRALGLYQRALRFGLRGLEARHPGIQGRLREDPEAALAPMKPEDVPFLYWTAAAWGLAIGASSMAPDMIADFPLVERLARRALALDETWGDGAVHTLLSTVEATKPGGDLDAAEAHFRRALELDGGQRAGTYVGFAESVLVKRQDVRGFHALLDQALAVDLEARPDDRLNNIVMQRRARRLKAREEDYFLETLDEVREHDERSEP